MKFKTTIKEIKNGYNKIISLGYCEAQTLLQGTPERAYTSGIYGWNFDLYEVENSSGKTIAICTGYRGMPGNRPKIDVSEFEKRAKAIKRTDWASYKNELHQILIEWLDLETLNK